MVLHTLSYKDDHLVLFCVIMWCYHLTILNLTIFDQLWQLHSRFGTTESWGVALKITSLSKSLRSDFQDLKIKGKENLKINAIIWWLIYIGCINKNRHEVRGLDWSLVPTIPTYPHPHLLGRPHAGIEHTQIARANFRDVSNLDQCQFTKCVYIILGSFLS